RLVGAALNRLPVQDRGLGRGMAAGARLRHRRGRRADLRARGGAAREAHRGSRISAAAVHAAQRAVRAHAADRAVRAASAGAVPPGAGAVPAAAAAPGPGAAVPAPAGLPAAGAVRAAARAVPATGPMTSPFGSYQSEIYLQGLADQVPAFTTDLAVLESVARRRMDPGPFGYVAGGAGSGATVRANREAFDRWRIVPRMLTGATSRSLATTVLGTEMPAPVLLAPVGVQST